MGAIRDDLQRVFVVPPPPLDPRILEVQSARIKFGAGLGSRIQASLAAGGDPALPVPAPSPSWQWLFFQTLDGGVPAGAQRFSFRSEPIPFVGAITEIDVVSTDPGSDWQMRLSVEGVGPIFKTTQPTDLLRGAGFFRPTPPGFWPETEGLVFPLTSSGQVILLEFDRLSNVAPNLTVRVLVIAQPSG